MFDDRNDVIDYVCMVLTLFVSIMSVFSDWMIVSQITFISLTALTWFLVGYLKGQR